MYNNKNPHYNQILQSFQNTNNHNFLYKELNLMRLKTFTSFEKDTYDFLFDTILIGKEIDNNDIIGLSRDICVNMCKYGDEDMLLTVLELTITSIIDCFKVIEIAFEKKIYDTTFNSIINFIKKEKKFDIIDEIVLYIEKYDSYNKSTFKRDEVLYQFYNRINIVLERDARVKVKGVFFLSSSWSDIKLIQYTKYMDKYKRFIKESGFNG